MEFLQQNILTKHVGKSLPIFWGNIIPVESFECQNTATRATKSEDVSSKTQQVVNMIWGGYGQ